LYNKLVLFLKFLHFVNNNNRGAPKVGGGGGCWAAAPSNQNLRNADFVEMMILKFFFD